MNEETGKFLANQLYPDLKNWIPTLYKQISAPFKKAISPVYNSINELQIALKNNELEPNSWITLKCKPFTFGPFLRNHFLTPIIGLNTEMRLGPRISHNNPIMAIFSQVTTHLKPVGLYPPIDNDLYQICLYPTDANICGAIGLLPKVNNLVTYLPALTNSKNLNFCGLNCRIKGILRQIDPKLLTDLNIPIEKYEELRQKGDTWFIDLSTSESEVDPYDATVTEMWGGLYATGHIEILDGQLKLKPLVDGLFETIKDAGYTPTIQPNKAGSKEITIFAKGIRAVIGTQAPVYSIHMDAEIASHYKINKTKFDIICKGYLNIIKETAKSCNVNIANPDDLDFSYTDSEKSYSVLKSKGADYIADVTSIAVRDWHRKRGC